LSILDSSANAAEGPVPHGKPGTVTYGTIISLPDTIKRSFGETSLTNGDTSRQLLQEQDARNFTAFRERIRDSSTIGEKVKIRLLNVASTELGNYQYVGLIPEGPHRQGPWTSVTRVFLRPDGFPIFLYEWDFVADGGSIVVFKELLNEKVGNIPARLVVKQSRDGRAMSTITWATGTRDVTISVWGDVLTPAPGSPYDRSWLLGIAERLAEP